MLYYDDIRIDNLYTFPSIPHFVWFDMMFNVLCGIPHVTFFSSLVTLPDTPC